MLEQDADLAIVVGGYNSSNTSHLVELCEEKLLTYYIDNSERIISKNKVSHFNFHKKIETTTADFLPKKNILKILITSGASCPDALVENIIKKLSGYYITEDEYKTAIAGFI